MHSERVRDGGCVQEGRPAPAVELVQALLAGDGERLGHQHAQALAQLAEGGLVIQLCCECGIQRARSGAQLAAQKIQGL